MSADLGDYKRAGLNGFTMRPVITQPDSPLVHDAEASSQLPLPQGPDRRHAVQWFNKSLGVSVMEDEMRPFEQKILQLWDMQNLYAMTIDQNRRDSVIDPDDGQHRSGESREHPQKLISQGKRATIDVNADVSEELSTATRSRRDTA